jgi:hypothetical protein
MPRGDIMPRIVRFGVLITLSIVTSVSVVYSQSNDSTDETRHTPASIIRSDDNHYFIAGNSYSQEKGGSFWIWKVDSDGQKVWEKRFKSESQDKIKAIMRTDDGGILALGHGFVYSPAVGYRCWVKRLDRNGKTIFTKIIGGFGRADVLLGTTDGNYLFAGTTKRRANKRKEDYDAWLVKFDSSGKLLWERFYDKTFDESVFSAVNIQPNGFVFAETSGQYNKFGRGPSEGWVSRLDSTGAILGEAKLPKCTAMSGGAYLATNARELAVIYSTSQLPPINKVPLSVATFAARIVGFDYRLKESWGTNLGGYSSILAPMIAASPDGNYIVAGAVEEGVRVDKVAPGGKVIWEKTGASGEKGYPSIDVEGVLVDGNFALVVGSVTDLMNRSIGSRVFLLKIETALGQVLWQRTY